MLSKIILPTLVFWSPTPTSAVMLRPWRKDAKKKEKAAELLKKVGGKKNLETIKKMQQKFGKKQDVKPVKKDIKKATPTKKTGTVARVDEEDEDDEMKMKTIKRSRKPLRTRKRNPRTRRRNLKLTRRRRRMTKKTRRMASPKLLRSLKPLPTSPKHLTNPQKKQRKRAQVKMMSMKSPTRRRNRRNLKQQNIPSQTSRTNPVVTGLKDPKRNQRNPNPTTRRSLTPKKMNGRIGTKEKTIYGILKLVW